MAAPAADPAGGARAKKADATDASRRELDALVREAARLGREASLARGDSVRSARALLDVEARLALANARIDTLQATLAERDTAAAELSERLARAQRVNAAIQASLSWQVTAPLRALKRRV